jgi:hypothetical protein
VTCLSKHRPLKHLGTLRGGGALLTQDGEEIGPVTYEIDGYLERATRSANGQIQGDNEILKQAYGAGAAIVALAGGGRVLVALSDQRGSSAAEVRVSGSFPL